MNSKTIATIKELMENAILLLDTIEKTNASEKAELRQIREYAITILCMLNYKIG